MSSEWVVVKVVGSRFDAELTSSLLDSAGIKSSISSDDVGGMEPQMQAQTGVRILVEKESEQAAKDLLAQADLDTGSDEADQEPWTCSGCGEELEGTFFECWQCGESRYQ